MIGGTGSFNLGIILRPQKSISESPAIYVFPVPGGPCKMRFFYIPRDQGISKLIFSKKYLDNASDMEYGSGSSTISLLQISVITLKLGFSKLE